jgi:HEAT repeats
MRNTGSAPVWVPVIVALGAMGIALAAILGKSDEGLESSESDRVALEQRVSNLEEMVHELRVTGQPPPSPTEAERASPAANAAIEARLLALEKQLSIKPPPAPEARPAVDSSAAVAELVRKQREAEAKESAGPEALQKQAMDRSLAGYERLKALARLRAIKDGRSRDVVLSMLQLFHESDDPKIRADIFRQLNKVEEPELRDALIDALRADQVSEVREEAAETLGTYRDDPSARDALEYAAENDASEKVRKKAKDALGGER